MQPSAVILCYLSVADLSIRELARTASTNGYDGVSLFVNAPADGLPMPILKAGTEELREARKLLDGEGLIVNEVEVFDLSGLLSRDANRRVLEAGAELGAQRATCVAFAPVETGKLAERLHMIAFDAADYGLDISIEFMAPAIAGDFNSIARAMEIIELAGMPNVGLTLDMLHLTRTEATVEDLKALPADRIGYIQLCDGPASMPAEDQLQEAGWGRLYPGEGEFALREMLAVLPNGKPVGLEIPNRGKPSELVAREGMLAARKFLNRDTRQ